MVSLRKNLRIFCFQKTSWLDNLLPSVPVWVSDVTRRFTTLLQRSNAVLRLKSSLQIVQFNDAITYWKRFYTRSVAEKRQIFALTFLCLAEFFKGISIISKIQLVVHYQCCVLIGWATTRPSWNSESIAHSAFGLMGYWLKANSSSRNNC